MKHLLTIAGSDSSGGAGIQADLKTFAAHGTFGMSVITAVTAQNTTGVTRIQNIDAEVVAAQIDAVFSDIHVDAVKVGMVSITPIIETIAKKMKAYVPSYLDGRRSPIRHDNPLKRRYGKGSPCNPRCLRCGCAP